MTSTQPERTVTMLDLASEYEIFKDRIRQVVDEVLERQQFIGGPINYPIRLPRPGNKSTRSDTRVAI